MLKQEPQLSLGLSSHRQETPTPSKVKLDSKMALAALNPQVQNKRMKHSKSHAGIPRPKRYHDTQNNSVERRLKRPPSRIQEEPVTPKRDDILRVGSQNDFYKAGAELKPVRQAHNQWVKLGKAFASNSLDWDAVENNCNLLRRLLAHHRDLFVRDLSDTGRSVICGPIASKLSELARSQRIRVAKAGFLTISDLMRTASVLKVEGAQVTLKNLGELVSKLFVQCFRRSGDPNDFIRSAAQNAVMALAEYGETTKVLEALAGLGDYMPSIYIKFTIIGILDQVISKEGNNLSKLGSSFIFWLQKLVQLLQDKDPKIQERARLPLLGLLKATDRDRLGGILKRRLSESQQITFLSNAQELLKGMGVDPSTLEGEQEIQTNFLNPTISSIFKQKKEESGEHLTSSFLPPLDNKSSIMRQSHRPKQGLTSLQTVKTLAIPDLRTPAYLESPKKGMKTARSEGHIRRHALSPPSAYSARRQTRISRGAQEFQESKKISSAYRQLVELGDQLSTPEPKARKQLYARIIETIQQNAQEIQNDERQGQIFFLLLKGIGDRNPNVAASLLNKLQLALPLFKTSIEQNLWQFVEALALHVAGGNIALSRYAGNILAKGLDGCNRAQLMSVLCSGVVEGGPAIRRCLLDMVLKLTPEILRMEEEGKRIIKRYVIPLLLTKLLARGWEELRHETRDLVLLLEKCLGDELAKMIPSGRWMAVREVLGG